MYSYSSISDDKLRLEHSVSYISRSRRRKSQIVQGVTYALGFILCLLYILDKWTSQHAKMVRTGRHGHLDVCKMNELEMEYVPQFVDISFEDATKDDELVGWEEDWVAFGALPYVEPGTSLGKTKIDAVISWVNGSEPTFRDERKSYAMSSNLNQPDSTWLHDSLSRHREWSQVQWAMLSCSKNIENLNRLQVLTSHGQVPTFPDLTEQEQHSLQRALDYVPDYTLYDSASRECSLPTFNSVSIEVNMGNIPSQVDKFIYLCDDMLLTTRYRDGDLYTPLFGLSTIIYDGLVWNVDQDEPHNLNQPHQGEYPEYSHSSFLFNSAFGRRNRAYIRHASKIYSRKLLREVKAAFPASYADASLSRFRGDRRVINPHFHAHHYVIERHRKALLWSFLQLKADVNGDGLYSWTERTAIKNAILRASSVPSGNTRQTMMMMKKDLYTGGFSSANALKPKWSSFDGPSYAFFDETKIEKNPIYHEYKTSVPDKPHLSYRCELDYDLCFGKGFFEDRTGQFVVEDILNRVSRDITKCGDCLINKLVLASGNKGLNAFLPGTEAPQLRELAVKAIMRYTYTKNKLLGNMIILGPSDYDLDLMRYKLDILMQGHEAMPAQMCINDDVPMETPLQRVEEIRLSLEHFYRSILDGSTIDPLRTYDTPIMPKKNDYAS